MSPRRRTHELPFGLQAPASQYVDPTYLSPQRLSSVGFQYSLGIGLGGHSYLDVGSGNGLLVWLLRRQGKLAIAVDHNSDTRPGVVGLLPHLPFLDAAVDVSLCFQVLEHMPFSMLGSCLTDLARVSRLGVIISVPDQTEPMSCRYNMERRFYHRFRFPRRWKGKDRGIDEEHFWELGHDGLEPGDLCLIASACGLTTTRHFRNPHFPYHHFFVLALSGGSA